MLEAIIEIIIKSAVIMAFPLGALPLIIHVERRGAAFIQKRVGPNRVGPFGLLQPLADVAKFMFKEEVHPSHARGGGTARTSTRAELPSGGIVRVLNAPVHRQTRCRKGFYDRDGQAIAYHDVIRLGNGI